MVSNSSMPRVRTILLSSVLPAIVAAYLIGCGGDASPTGSGTARRVIFLDFDDPLPAFDMCFTWTGYDAAPQNQGDLAIMHRNVQYSVDGRPVGVGVDGFRKVIEQVATLRQGARVLIYPYYEYHDERLYEEGGTVVPFLNQSGPLNDLFLKKSITVIYSYRDPQGNLHPDCAEVYKQWKLLKGPASQPDTHRSIPSATAPASPVTLGTARKHGLKVPR